MSPVLTDKDKLDYAGKSGKRILVVTGASGGHIFPAISFLESLKDRYKSLDALLVLPRKGMNPEVFPDGLKVKYHSIVNISLSLNAKNFIAMLKFIKGTLESMYILLEFKPDIVIGFGSIDSVPMLLLAWLARIKTLIHEQNVVPGRANRLLARFSDRIAISFAETKNYLSISQDRIVVTGNPIRKQLENADRLKAINFFGFDEDRITILVMGGSLGSHRINMCFLQAVSKIIDTSSFQVIHITGAEDYDSLNNSYKYLNLKVKIFSFLKDMQYAYSISDFAVSRAGATTIAELSFFKLPAIIIPYPFAYKHQLGNARVLGNNGCAILIDDNELNPDLLKQALEQLLNDSGKLKNMRLSYNNFSGVHANESLIKEVLSLQSP